MLSYREITLRFSVYVSNLGSHLRSEVRGGVNGDGQTTVRVPFEPV